MLWQNSIFILGSALKNSFQQKILRLSRGQIDKGCLTDFSIDEFFDDDSNSSPPLEKKPSRNVVNVDICRASKGIFDKDVNLLVPTCRKAGPVR